jgi:hypothetical protein
MQHRKAHRVSFTGTQAGAISHFFETKFEKMPTMWLVLLRSRRRRNRRNWAAKINSIYLKDTSTVRKFSILDKKDFLNKNKENKFSVNNDNDKGFNLK